jgi:type II secretory pathway pseudopilin PulG
MKSPLRHRHQRGLSLVELMVGIAIGFFITGAAVLVATSQLTDTRRLLLDTQLQQDLRATADIITRELRRAGSAGSTEIPQNGIWHPTTASVTESSFFPISPPDDESASSEVEFRYRRGSGVEGPFGFVLEGGVIRSLIGLTYQELTDPLTMTVTDFAVTADPEQVFQVPCPRTCPDGTTDCWPSLIVRGYQVSITAESPTDGDVVRTIRSHVRLRNDWLRHNDPGVSNRACPA